VSRVVAQLSVKFRNTNAKRSPLEGRAVVRARAASR
jgi:hypothetical protein